MNSENKAADETADNVIVFFIISSILRCNYFVKLTIAQF